MKIKLVSIMLARQLNFSLEYISYASSEVCAISFALCTACCSHSQLLSSVNA
jgi:hypothetical protein